MPPANHHAHPPRPVVPWRLHAALATAALLALVGAAAGCEGGVILPRQTPPEAALTTTIAVGEGHSCAIGADGRTYCWGGNEDGALGITTGELCGLVPCSTTPVAVETDLRFSTLAAGDDRTCGIAADGQAYCWGMNFQGALGVGDTVARRSPAAVAGGHRFQTIAAGRLHTCGLTAEGVAYCWGYNGYGQLGNGAGGGANDRSTTPVQVVGGLRFTRLAAGTHHTCGIAQGGTAYCWGDDTASQLGTGVNGPTNGEGSFSRVPVRVAGSLHFTGISAGHDHTCALDAAGAAHCWGWNGVGQLGTGTAQLQRFPSPRPVTGGLRFTHIAVGTFTSCGIVEGGTAYCWPSGAPPDARVAVPAAIPERHALVAVNANHACSISPEGAAWCWGNGGLGQLGTGGTAFAPAPVRVEGGVTFRLPR